MGKQENNIALSLYSYLNSKRGHDVVIPNFFLGDYECDMVKFHDSGLISEYEIKISRSDYRKDFTKKKNGKYKHKELASGLLPTNKYYFVVPKDMVKIDEVPTYAGLIYITPSGSTSVVKPAPFLHKNKYMDSIEKYKKLVVKLSFREMTWRQKYETLKLRIQKNNV